MRLDKKQKLVQKRRWRVRNKVRGTASRPRLTVHFSGQHIYAQCINDDESKTLVSATTLQKDFKSENIRPNVAGAILIGKAFGKKAKAAGLGDVVFDRGARRYHGAVKAFADAAREEGLKF